GRIVGGAWIVLAGALRQYRGINETISSLLLTYIAVAVFNHIVEGPLRDPASLNKPSTPSIGDANMLGQLPGLDVHWGLGFGLVFCVLMNVLMWHTTSGFALRNVGGNTRAARLAGLPVGRLVLLACFLGGAGRGPCRDGGGGGRSRQRQRVADRRLRVHRNPRRVHRASEPARDRARGRAARRHLGQRRHAAASPGSSRRHRAGPAGRGVHAHPRERNALWPSEARSPEACL